MQVTLGLQSNKTLTTYGRIAALAETFRFDGISVFSDLGFQPSLPALLEIARCSQSLRIGPACYSPILTHPLEIAGQIAMLDHASHGRAYLGLARGSWMDVIGLSQHNALSRIEETLCVLRLLLSGNDEGFSGQHFTVQQGFQLSYPVLRTSIELLLGAWGPQGLALGAREFDEVKLGGCANPTMVALARAELDAATPPQTGHRTRTKLVCGAVTVIDQDGAMARRLARQEVALYLDVVAHLDRTYEVAPDVLMSLRRALTLHDREAAGRCIPDEVLSRFALAGTPSEIIDQIGELRAAGIDRVEFGTPHGIDEMEGIQLLGTLVLPELRRLV
ncbi:MAG: LLM class flavin-dependent oxidoreductase [Acidimicrobiales bacterium]